MESIDETIDPCENFYQFACGTWLTNNRIADDGELDIFYSIKSIELIVILVPILNTFQVLQTELENKLVGKVSSKISVNSFFLLSS